MIINGREIGRAHPPYVIAEVSCNHGGSLDRALELIDAAKFCGADAVKFQCVMANTITIDSNRPEFTIKDGPWAGRNLYELYCETQTPFEWFPAIKERADKVGITWFASVFDKTAIDLMEKLGAPAIKISSFELVDTPLIADARETGLPLILSTGMASYHEISAAIKAIEPYNQWDHALLHCVSEYPTPHAQADLLRPKYGIRHGFVDGISDHSVGPEIPIAATACGVSIIEKHFRLSWHPDTEDSPFSLDEVDLMNMVKQVKNTYAAMQPPTERAELMHRPLRRSLFAVANIAMGERFTEDNVRSIRPGHGLPPDSIDKVIGRTAAADIKRGEPLDWRMIE